MNAAGPWPALMNKRHAAAYLDMSERNLDRLRKKHLITAYGAEGDAVKFKRTELDRYIDSLPERIDA